MKPGRERFLDEKLFPRNASARQGERKSMKALTSRFHSPLELVPAGQTGADPVNLTVDVPWIPPHPAGMIKLGRIADGFIADLKKRMNHVVVDSQGDQSLAGAPGRRIHARGTFDGQAMLVDAVVLLRQETVYVLDEESDAGHAAHSHAAMEQIISSWQWK